MSEWEWKKLSDIAELCKNIWKVGDERLPYIGLEHIEGGKLRLSGIGSTDEVTSNKYLFNRETFLFGKLRPYFRKLIKVKFDGVCSTDIWVVKTKKGNDIDYLFYFFSVQSFIDLSYATSSGTRMPRADWNFVKDTEWWVPSYQEQRAIAEVLSSLDDKIDLLHRQNKTLESLAETLFRHYFIDNARNDWEKKSLEEIADITIGRTPPRKETQWFSKDIKDIKWISIKDMAEQGVFIFNTAEYLTRQAVEKFRIPLIPKNTVVLSFKMTLGRVGITSEEMLSNEAIAHFKIKRDKLICEEFLYIFLKLFQYKSLGSTSSIVTSINSEMIKALPVIIPTMTYMMEFKEQVHPLFKKTKENQRQIQTLEKLRDTLLPKLISGKIRVKNKASL